MATEAVVVSLFFFSSRRRHTRLQGDWSSDVCSSDLHLEVDVAVLAAAARLAHVASLRGGRLADRLPIGHLGPADVRVDPELAQQAVDDDLEVQLAHPVDERLARLLLARHPERRVLEGQTRQRYTEPFLVGARLRLDRDR